MTPAPITTIGRSPAEIEIVYYDKSHRYKIRKDDEPLRFVPSVSTILDKAVPKNLTGWAERLTVWGMVQLQQMGRPLDRLGPDAILAELHSQGLRYYQARDAAADKGTDVHRALEELAEGKIPNLREYQLDRRGHIQAVAKWWLEYEPKVLHSELMVASWVHQYAGRMDLLCEVDGIVEVTDLKTSKAVRESHHFQTAGYRIGVEECGYPVPQRGSILRTSEDGTFEYVQSHATPEHFIALVESYKAQKAFETETKRLLKAAA